MENNKILQYEKLDLAPFTFSSPNSTGWNDLEFKNLLEDTVLEDEIPKDPVPFQSNILIELFVNDSEVFVPLPRKEAVDYENTSINKPAFQQDWKRPLTLPKPEIEKTNAKVSATMTQNEAIYENNSIFNKTVLQQDGNQSKPKTKQTSLKKNKSKLHPYLHLLRNMQNRNIQTNTFSRLQNKIDKQTSTTFNNHSSKPIQKITKTKKQPKTNSAHLSSLLNQTHKSLPTPPTNHHSEDQLIDLIRQLNKQTLEKLQKRLAKN